jgi:competence protein ComEA
MRPRGSAHADAVSRRLELLSAELAAVRGEAGPRDAPAPGAATDAWAVPDLHTHVRADRSGGPLPTVPLLQPLPPPPATPSAPDEPEADPPPAPPAVPVPGRHARRRRWSPGSLLAGRVALGPGQAAALAVLAAAALAVTAWWVVRDHGEPLALPAGPASGASPAALATGGSPPGPSSGVGPGATPGSTEVVVDVAGKVRRPGIVVLDPGSRVVDALEAAGGARPGADLTGLNLARLLVDGEQILVGVPPVPGIVASAAGSPGPEPGPLVDLNTAGLEQLDTLPGVGPVTAQAILDWRAAHGGFQSVDQLLDVDGIGEKTLAELAPLVTV